MKKIFFIFCLVPFFGMSQTINGLSVDDLFADYIEIVGTAKLLKPFQVNITVNYGQVSKMSEVNRARVIGENGKPYPFNGMMGAVNFFSERGYVLDMAYPVSTGNSNVYHYIMRKEK